MRNLVRIALGISAAASATSIGLAVLPQAGSSQPVADRIHFAVPEDVRSVGRYEELLAYLYVRQLSDMNVNVFLSAESDEVKWFAAVTQQDQGAPQQAPLSQEGSSSSATTADEAQSLTGSDAWSRVAMCEEGGRNDPTFGYYGITPQSWAAYGGTAYATMAGGASQAEQQEIADRINGGYVPDANGCASW